MAWIPWLKRPGYGNNHKQNAIDAMLAQLRTGPLTTDELFAVCDPVGRVSAFHHLRKERIIHIVGRRAKKNKIYSLWAIR